MICPNCKAEYRPGFTSCSDCHVELVEKLPEGDSPAAYVVLWRGEDPGFHDMLVGELDRADIPYADVPLDVYLRYSEDAFNIKATPRFGFVVSVRNPDLRASRAILENLAGGEAGDFSLPDTEDTHEEIGLVSEAEVPLHWDPELATLEVWSGNDPRMAKFLEASLRENGIPARVFEEIPEKLSVLVCPDDDTPARELVHQIAEASLPESTLQRPGTYIWRDEPVRSYLFAWLPALVFYVICFFVLYFGRPEGSSYVSTSFITGIFAVVSFVADIGSLWMIYQAVRYEIRPWRFVLLALVPLSFVWYYNERYSRRRGPYRIPIAVRMRISPPTA
jgi:hypothetical protein